jgi:hypothetical protein
MTNLFRIPDTSAHYGCKEPAELLCSAGPRIPGPRIQRNQP